MNTRFWISLGISVLVVAGSLYATLAPQTTLPFDATQVGRTMDLVVQSSVTGSPMPAGLQSGDIIDLSRMHMRDRMAFLTNVGNPPTNAIVHVMVQRGGQMSSVPVHFVRIQNHGAIFTVFVANMALNWLFVFLALLLLWRGRRQAAAAVCLWCLLNILTVVATNFSLPIPVQGTIGMISEELLFIGTLVALYLLADDLTRAGITAAVRRWVKYLFIFIVLVYGAGSFGIQIRAVGYGEFWPHFNVVFTTIVLLHLAAFVVPLALLAVFYRRAPAAERARIRWVWAGILMYVASYVAEIFAAHVLNPIQANLLVTALTALAFLAFTYAVLRHRLVSIRLVLNRAMVYGAITTLVVGVFAALSSIIDRFAIGRTEGALLQLLVPLTLGVTLSVVKKRLDRFVERLFFQRQYRAEAALSRFARQCSFIENREVLLDRCVDVIQECLKPTGAALYEKTDAGYRRVRQSGERGFPAQLPTDDPVFVGLRAELAEADLDTLTSGLGPEGLVFPLAVRGALLGALVLGQRPAEHYTQQERTLLARIAQQVAASLHALRGREAEAFVDAVARGRLAADTETQLHAQQLLREYPLASS